MTWSIYSMVYISDVNDAELTLIFGIKKTSPSQHDTLAK